MYDSRLINRESYITLSHMLGPQPTGPHDFPPPSEGGTEEGEVRVRSCPSSSFRPGPHGFPPPSEGGTEEGEVRVRSCPSSSVRPGPHGFPPPAGGGTEQGVVGV